MIRKILVPLDGSALSESILSHVRRLLLRQGADVVLLRVLRALALPTREPESSAQRLLRELRTRLNESGVAAHDLLLEGDPATEILSTARDLQPSLIAMSTHGRGGVGRLVRGSVAEQVLRRADHPLLMASPKGLDDHRSGLHAGFRRILVPLDGTDRSAGVIPLVREFAEVYESRVTLLHVAPHPVSWEQHAPLEFAGRLEEPRLVLEEAGISVRVQRDMGAYAPRILRAVEEDRSDLVVMRTHGHSGVSRWVLGSVAEQVLRHCPVPSLVFRGEAFGAGDQSDREETGIHRSVDSLEGSKEDAVYSDGLSAME